MNKGDVAVDPRGLIREAYRMDVGPADCRTIFFDWALGQDAGSAEQVRALLDHYEPDHPDHPMTAVLREGLERSAAAPRRRGGRRSRPTE